MSTYKQSSADTLLTLTSEPDQLFTPSHPPPSSSTDYATDVRRRCYLSRTLVALAVSTLVTWIIAAAVLTKKELSVPLDFFDGGSTWVTADSYNVIITATSSLNGILVGAAIARAVQALLRHLIVRRRGVSVDTFDALVCWQDRIMLWRWKWHALVAFSIFLIALLLDSATMAAFGQSVSKENITSSADLITLARNPDLNLSASGAFTNTIGLGDVEFNIVSVATNLMSNPTDTPVRVFPSLLDSTLGNPLFSTFFALGSNEDDSEAAGEEAVETMTTSQAKKLNATTATTIRVPLEGFMSSVQCDDGSSSANVSSDLAIDDQLTRYDFDFAVCGTRRAFYPRAGAFNTTVDTFACQDGTPTVFVFGLNTTAGDVSWIESCSVATSSASFPVAIVFGGSSGFPNTTTQGPPQGPATDLNSGDVVQLLGSALLNQFGSAGWADVALWLQPTSANGSAGPFDDVGRREFLETLLGTITKATLANFATFLGINQAELSDSVNMTQVVAQTEVTVLSIHLRGSQLAWFIVPTSLLLLLLSLSYFLLHSHSGFIDLCDPLNTALLGLSSPRDRTISAFGTGKKHGENRVRMGVPRSNGRFFAGEREEERLVLMTVGEEEDEGGEKSRGRFA